MSKTQPNSLFAVVSQKENYQHQIALANHKVDEGVCGWKMNVYEYNIIFKLWFIK